MRLLKSVGAGRWLLVLIVVAGAGAGSNVPVDKKDVCSFKLLAISKLLC